MSGVLFADGLEDAFVGMGQQFNRHVAVYDLDRIIEVLMRRDGMSYDDAQEHIEFNVLGAWAGPQTPIFLKRVPLAQAKNIAAHLED
jgi:hypothetical protein